MPQKGNIHELAQDPVNRGWIAGPFYHPEDPTYSDKFEIKWVIYKKGDTRKSPAQDHSRKSIDIVISGLLRFCFDSTGVEYILGPGELVSYDVADSDHSVVALEDVVQIVIREAR